MTEFQEFGSLKILETYVTEKVKVNAKKEIRGH